MTRRLLPRSLVVIGTLFLFVGASATAEAACTVSVKAGVQVCSGTNASGGTCLFRGGGACSVAKRPPHREIPKAEAAVNPGPAIPMGK